jgi:hypothetical protein
MGVKIGSLLAIAIACLMLGCGSGGDESSSEPLTKTAFINQGNAICEEGMKEKERALQAGYDDLGGQEGSEKEKLEELVSRVLPPVDEMTEKLSDLTPPAKDEEAVSAFLEGYEQDLQEAEDDPSRALEDDFLKDPNQAAQEYGLTSCNF